MDSIALTRTILGLGVVIVFLMAGVSCSSPRSGIAEFAAVEDPVLPDLSSVDAELAEYLALRRELVLQHPTSAAERGRLAMAYDVNDWSQAALEVYDQAHRLDPFEFMWPYFSSLIHASLGDFESALGSVDSALDINPRYSPALLWKGTWLSQLSQYERAVDVFEAAYAIDGSVYSIFGKAQALFQNSDPQAAADLLEPLRSRAPHPQLFRLLAQVYGELSRHEEAEIAHALGVENVTMSWPDSLVARREVHVRGFGGRLAIAQRLLQARRTEDALRQLEVLQANYPNRPALVSTLAWAYSLGGDTELAIASLQIGIEENPDHQPFYVQLGDLLSMSGHLSVALDLLQKSVELNESDPEAHALLGTVYMRLEEFHQSVTAFNKALELGVSDTADVHVRLGTIAGYRQDWETSITHLKQAIELQPRNVVGHERLCFAYIESGQLDELEDALEWAEQLGIPPEEFDLVREYRDQVLRQQE